MRSASAGRFLQKMLDKDSLQGRFEDEIINFLRNTSIGNRKCEPLQWWKLNAHHFLSVESVARDILPVQETSVASESSLSIAGNLVDDDRCRLGDEAIKACMLLRSWSRFTYKTGKSNSN